MSFEIHHHHHHHHCHCHHYHFHFQAQRISFDQSIALQCLRINYLFDFSGNIFCHRATSFHVYISLTADPWKGCLPFMKTGKNLLAVSVLVSSSMCEPLCHPVCHCVCHCVCLCVPLCVCVYQCATARSVGAQTQRWVITAIMLKADHRHYPPRHQWHHSASLPSYRWRATLGFTIPPWLWFIDGHLHWNQLAVK